MSIDRDHYNHILYGEMVPLKKKKKMGVGWASEQYFVPGWLKIKFFNQNERSWNLQAEQSELGPLHAAGRPLPHCRQVLRGQLPQMQGGRGHLQGPG